MKITLIAIGRLKKGPLFELCADYKARIKLPVTLEILDSKQGDPLKAKREEEAFILSHIKDDSFVISLDERGKTLGSVDFAHKIEGIQNSGRAHLHFIIGGADGLSEEIRARADLLLSFGVQTWPHMLARVMILEQIYRAQTILQNHPYHRA